MGNVGTGAATAALAVILVDASKGNPPQTRRHAFIAAQLGIRHVLAAINKMDLVDYREEVFADCERDFMQLARQLGVAHVRCVAISALEGDNVVERSERTSWYQGPTLLEHLESVPRTAGDPLESLRFPVQMVIRPDARFRGFCGRVASGVIRPGDEVLALPSGRRTHVRSIVSYDGDLPEAFAPMSATLQLEDEIDLSRGDMLGWLDGTSLEVGRTYLVKDTGRQTKIRALQIRHRVNVNTLEQEQATLLNLNDIASVEFETHVPLFFDPYAGNRATGSFILIDLISNATIGAGMIQEELRDLQGSEELELTSLQIEQRRVSSQERY